MTSQTVRVEKLTLTPTNPQERAVWLGATVDGEHSEIVVRTHTGRYLTNGEPARESKALRFASSYEVAALEDALRVMRVRMEEHERASLTK